MPASEHASCEIPSIRQPSPRNTHVRWSTTVMSVAVEACRQDLLRDGHAHRVREALAERPGRRLDPGGVAVLGVARGHRVELAEAPQLVERQRVAAQVQQCVEEHRAVPVGEHEAVPVRPTRGRRDRAAGGRSTAPRRCPPSPSACRDGRTSHAAPRPWPARGPRWRALCVKALLRNSPVEPVRVPATLKAQYGTRLPPARRFPVPVGAVTTDGGRERRESADPEKRRFSPRAWLGANGEC